MKLHTMTLTMNPHHNKRSLWVFDRYWNIEKVSQLDKVIDKLDRWTAYDRMARVLCAGLPTQVMKYQRRIYIVKMGNDNLLWNNKYQLYDEVREQLIMSTKPKENEVE